MNKDYYITLAEAAEIMVDALNNWKVTHQYFERCADDEISETWLVQRETEDEMKIVVRNGKLWDITIWREDEIVDYTIKED